MAVEILMPALSPTMEEGKLAKWLVKEGDKITSGTIIAEIETDKATMEFEAVDEGVLARILVPEGTEGVKVNTPIALIGEQGEKVEAPKAAPAKSEAKSEAKTATPQTVAKPAPAKAEAPKSVQTQAEGERVIASPLARRIAGDAKLDLAGVLGSGPHGRIVKADVEAAIAKGPAPKAEAKVAAALVAAAPAASVQIADPHEDVPLSSMRKTIARRLTEAKRDIPHYYLTVDCELDALMALRQQLNAKAGEGVKLSVNDFIIRASALALKKLPEVNAAWAGDRIAQFKNVDISIAVAIEGGLITPIIRNADARGLADISGAMRELGQKAKAGKLKPEEYQGGGFSISNLGMYGIRQFTAVINPPQACILAVGAGEQRPVVKDGALAVATVMTVTMSCDHRVVDGALGARWLKVFKGYVEDPLTMML
jgi:pyruvate dehydrogenase E2 component (dihydrolipoamide acetyltransferase)